MTDSSAGQLSRVGLFGGTFDPVHEGHLAVANLALVQLRLDKVIFIPSGIPPAAQKSRPVAAPEARLAMLKLALGAHPQFGISEFEISRPRISYTVETIRHMAASHPERTAFFFLMGDDCAGKLARWVGIDEMRARVRFVAVTRGETAFRAPPWLTRLPMPRNPISSSSIRRRIAAGIGIDGLVHSDVADFISREGLYGAKMLERAYG